MAWTSAPPGFESNAEPQTVCNTTVSAIALTEVVLDAGNGLYAVEDCPVRGNYIISARRLLNDGAYR